LRTPASALAGGSGPVSAGTCQAPQITATFECCFIAARNTVRMYASRRRSSMASDGGNAGVLARTSVMAKLIASNGASASARSSSPTTGR
jgi:hypothetical protein